MKVIKSILGFLKNTIFDICKGIVIGVANVIPGVSGGTMMVSMEIYDKIIGSINNLFKEFKKSILTLLPYGIGMLLGIVGFSFAITWMFEKAPLETALLFIGFIFGGLPIIWRNLKNEDGKVKVDVISIILFVIFFGLVIGLEILGQHTGVEKSLTVSLGGIILSIILGIIASATMIIPGVSGSMVMMIMGYYNSIIGSIKGCVESLVAFDFGKMFANIGVLLPFAVGIVIGLFGVAKLIEFLISRFKSKTYASILGLVVASPYPVFVHSGISNVSALSIVLGIVLFAFGIFFTIRFDKISEK